MLYLEIIRVSDILQQFTVLRFLRTRFAYFFNFFFYYFSHSWSRSRVVVGLAIRLRAGRSGSRIPSGTRDFPLFVTFLTGCGFHPASYSICTLILSRGKIGGRGLNFTTHVYTGCNRRNGPDFGRVFLMLNYTEKPQNTYIQS